MEKHPHGEQISAYLDGMLDLAQMRRLAAHIHSCGECRGTYESLRETKSLLKTTAAPAPPPAEFWANTYRRLRTEGQEPRRETLWETWRSALDGTQRRWAAGFAAAAALVVAAWGA